MGTLVYESYYCNTKEDKSGEDKHHAYIQCKTSIYHTRIRYCSYSNGFVYNVLYYTCNAT